tara:strand:- start:121 stop:1356 length:1236 start_codon:yes stop_codon:yes gene_type:complete
MDNLDLKHKPRKWQNLALKKWAVSNKGVVQVATAGGKTFFAFMCIKDYLNTNKEAKIIIMVPTIPLLDQWKLALIEELGINEDEISLGGGGNKFKSLKRFNLFVYKTGAKVIPNFDFDNYKFMLVVDECHKAGTENIRVIFEDNFKYDAALGLSATPRREYDSFFEDYVSPFLGNIIYQYSYAQGLEDGVIPNFELNNIKVWANGEEEQKILSIRKRIATKIKKIIKEDNVPPNTAFNYPEIQNLLYKLSNSNKNLESRILITAKILKKESYTRTIIFHQSINEAEKINYLLNSIGIPAKTYHSKLSPALRYVNLTEFKTGLFRVLVTCEALDEGLNIPSLDMAIISAGNLSKRQRIQRLGRTLRTSRSKEKAVIYTLYYSDQERERLLNEEKNLSGQSKVSWKIEDALKG